MKHKYKKHAFGLGKTLAHVSAGAAMLSLLPSADAQSMLHRWSFSGNGNDSIGGAPVTLVGTATIDASSLQLPGGGPFANYGSLNITNTLNTNASLTVESWFTINALQDWSKVWMFGKDSGGEPDLSYIGFTPRTGLGGNPPKIDFDTTLANEQNTSGGVNPAALSASTAYHVVSVFDAASDTISLYINGVLADTGSMGGGTVTNLSPNTMRIGSGFFYGDADFNGSVDELRIYRGAVGGLQVAVDSVTGPDTIDSTIALNSLVLNVGFSNVTIGDLQDTYVAYNTVSYGTINVTNSTEVTYSVAPSGIVSVSSNGRIAALAPGSAVVTATRGAKTSSATISVADVPLVLAHRYSFTDGDGTVAVDSVDAAWNGTIRNASIVNNEVVLPGGTFSSDPSTAHVDLPNGILTNFNSITIESWVTINGQTNWARLYDFGNSVGGEDISNGGTSYMMLAPQGNGNDLWAEVTPGQVTRRINNPMPVGIKTHVVYTIDALANTASLYLDGNLVALTTGATLRPKNLGVTLNNWIGRSQFNDLALNANVDEFRMWTRALKGSHVALSAYAGPNVVFTNATVVSVSVNLQTNTMIGGTTQQASVVANFAQTNGVPATGAVTNWTSSNTNVVTVNASGLITAVGPGNATISAKIDGVTGTSSAITISVVQPTISQQPVSTTKYVTGTAIFSVTAAGGQLTYQWKKNGVNIPGATTNSLVFSNIANTDNGASFVVGVSNNAGGVLSSSAILTVLTTPALAHRWSFDTGVDSVRGVNCSLRGGATISGGLLNLPGGGSRANCGEINGVDDATGNGVGLTLNTNASITLEGWLTVTTLNNWSKSWMIGFANGGAENGLSYIDFTPRAGANGNVPSMSLNTTNTGEVNTRGGTNPALWVAGQYYHAAAVYDADLDTMSMYLNGVLVDSAAMGGRKINQMNVTEGYLGAPVNFGDPDMIGSIDEFRIYLGALPGYQISANFQYGPSIVAGSPELTIRKGTSNNLILNWYTGTLQASPTVNGTYTNVVGATAPYTTTAAGTMLYYRVKVQ
jgi:uncharacterized protein YjdB